jgi:hypothetical protein
MVGRFVSGAKNCCVEERKEGLRWKEESKGEDFKRQSHPMKASSCH